MLLFLRCDLANFVYFQLAWRSLDRAIGVATRLWTGRSGFEFQQGQQNFLQIVQTGFGTHRVSYAMGTEFQSRGQGSRDVTLTSRL
jgi:hypothetical protein